MKACGAKAKILPLGVYCPVHARPLRRHQLLFCRFASKTPVPSSAENGALPPPTAKCAVPRVAAIQ
jgi:hypothetical protein